MCWGKLLYLQADKLCDKVAMRLEGKLSCEGSLKQHHLYSGSSSQQASVHAQCSAC